LRGAVPFSETLSLRSFSIFSTECARFILASLAAKVSARLAAEERRSGET
jgi:hypothetical protein